MIWLGGRAPVEGIDIGIGPLPVDGETARKWPVSRNEGQYYLRTHFAETGEKVSYLVADPVVKLPLIAVRVPV